MQLLILSNLTPRSAPDDYFLPSRSRTGRGDLPDALASGWVRTVDTTAPQFRCRVAFDGGPPMIRQC